MKLNEILSIEEQEEFLYLQIKNESNLVKLSKIEFEIISYYTRVLNKGMVIRFFSDDVLITREQLDVLLTLAKQKNLLVDRDYSNKTKIFTLRGKRRRAILEVFTIDFTNTNVERLSERKKGQNAVLLILICLALATLLFLFFKSFSFVEHYKKTLYLVPYSFNQLLVYIYLGAFVSIGIHELGHYYFYKRCEGKGSHFGFGLLLFVIPVFYNKLQISQIRKKRDRMLIHGGGFIFDLLFSLLILGCIVLLKDKAPALVFISYSMLISICIRSVFNLNIFLPQTDGYYFFSDCLNVDHLFQKSSSAFLQLFRGNISLKKIGYSLFFLLSCLSIMGAWLCFATPIFLFVYYAFFTS